MCLRFQESHQFITESGEVTDTGTYRPIATLSSFSKVLERLIYNQLYLFLEKKMILYININLALGKVILPNKLF